MEKLFTIQEAMEFLGVKSRATFYKLMDRASIPYVNLNVGGTYEARRFRREDLEQAFTNREG